MGKLKITLKKKQKAPAKPAPKKPATTPQYRYSASKPC